MPSVASQVNASINQYRDAKGSASASGQNSSSPFEDMLDSAVAAEDPAPSTKTTSAAHAQNDNGPTTAKSTKSADDAHAKDDATASQADHVARDEAARGELAEHCDAKLKALLSKALVNEAGGVPEIVQEVAPAQKPIVEIGLAAFLEAVSSATSAKPETEDQGDNAESDKADGDAPANAPAGAVKTEAVATAVATTITEVAAEVAQTDAGAAAKTTATVGAAPAVTEAAASSPEQAEGSLKTGESLSAEDQATGFDASLATQAEASKTKGQAASAAQQTEAAEHQTPDAKAGTATTKPEALVSPPQQPARHNSAEIGEAHAANASAAPVDAPAPAKPFDALQVLQTLPQITSPNVAPTQTQSFQRDVTPLAPAVPIEGVAIEIAAKASEGMKSFEIRLDPPELGRIHVRLDVDRNGELTSRVTADRQDTLDLLRRDAPQLERALNDAGVRTANNGLQFSLRDQGQQQQQQQQHLPHAARLIVADDSLAAELTQRGYYRPAGSAGGIDIRV